MNFTEEFKKLTGKEKKQLYIDLGRAQVKKRLEAEKVVAEIERAYIKEFGRDSLSEKDLEKWRKQAISIFTY